MTTRPLALKSKTLNISLLTIVALAIIFLTLQYVDERRAQSVSSYGAENSTTPKVIAVNNSEEYALSVPGDFRTHTAEAY